MSRTLELAYEHIYAAIARGRLAAGDHIREEMIAADLGISRTPVREAIRRLEGEGLVIITRNAGADVVDLDPEDVVETFRLRAMLEGYAVERAATRITAEELQTLEHLDQQLAALHTEGADLLSATRLNAGFHLKIAEAARNPQLHALIRSLVHVPLTLMHREGWGRRLADSRGYDEHTRIVQALRSGDGDLARSLMQTHILGARPKFEI